MTQAQLDALNVIVTEMQAVDMTALDAVVAANDKAVSDLQAFITANPVGTIAPATDPIVSITTTTQSGVTAVFTPEAELPAPVAPDAATE